MSFLSYNIENVIYAHFSHPVVRRDELTRFVASVNGDFYEEKRLTLIHYY